MGERLGIAGIPEDLDDVLAHCAALRVEPVFLGGPDDSPLRPDLNAISVPAWNLDVCANQMRSLSLAGLWAGTGCRSQLVQELTASLDLPHLPCLSERQLAALPIDNAVLFEFTELEHIRHQAEALAIPAWVRATCAGGDSSCMRVEHPNDLSLASTKLQKRNTEGPIRVQPVVDGPVYRLLAFKTDESLVVAGLVAEEVTSSVYRVPLGASMPVEACAALFERTEALTREVNLLLPKGWGYVELEFVDSVEGVKLVDVQCPARLDPQRCRLLELSRGLDLQRAFLQCALGRTPDLSSVRNAGVASTWLLTRSGVVTGFLGVEEARALPGVVEVNIVAKEGDILSHVVDIPSRERGGYVIAMGETAEEARERLEAARAMVWINTSPALF